LRYLGSKTNPKRRRTGAPSGTAAAVVMVAAIVAAMGCAKVKDIITTRTEMTIGQLATTHLVEMITRETMRTVVTEDTMTGDVEEGARDLPVDTDVTKRIITEG
jgi:hypothetical protein